MKFALLRCCTTPIFLQQYESSTNAVLERLGIEISGDTEFNCCGYPLRNFNPGAHLLASTRNLALAEKRGLNILTVCNCCYGSLKHAQHILTAAPPLMQNINETLAKEGLSYSGAIESRHLLQVLYDEIGTERIRRMIKKTFIGLKIAAHYGCHLLRPREVVNFDNPFAPVKFDRLVEITGAESIPWQTKLDCCGSPLLGTNERLSLDLTARKLENAKQAGADYLCVACPYCQIQFDRVQDMMLSQQRLSSPLPSILYPQLLGLCLGIDEKFLGLNKNMLSIGNLGDFLGRDTPRDPSPLERQSDPLAADV